MDGIEFAVDADRQQVAREGDLKLAILLFVQCPDQFARTAADADAGSGLAGRSRQQRLDPLPKAVDEQRFGHGDTPPSTFWDRKANAVQETVTFLEPLIVGN
jgi:hypothetical protein